MAGNAVIGALRVVLGAETAAFDKGLKDAEKTLAGFQKNMARIGTLIGVGMVAAATGFAVAIKKAIDEADKLGKMAQSFGIPVEQLSALKLAADLSGVSIEQVGKAVGILSRQMSEIAGGKATGGATEAFKALGISVTDSSGKLKTSTQVMEEVADRFAKMEDGAGKTALAIKIFGRAGADLIPLLNQGSKGIKETREEAERLGLIIDLRTAKSAEAFNDNLTRLSRVMTGVATVIAAHLGPMLQLLTNRFVETSQSGNVVSSTAQTIIGWFEKLVLAARIVPIAVTGIGRALLELGQAALLVAGGNLVAAARAIGRLEEVGKETDAQFKENRRTFQDFNEQARMLADHYANIGTQAGKAVAPVLAQKNALNEFIKSQAKAIAGQRAEAETVGQAAGAKESLRIILQGQAIAQENNIRLTALQREQLAALAGEARNAALVQEGYNILLANAEPHEKYRLELQNSEAALRSIGATSEQIGINQQKIAERFGATWEQVTATVAGQFSQLFTQLAKHGSGWATAAKALAIVEATINTYVAYTKALVAAPPPFNYVLAAGTLAAGLAKVMAIKAQTVPKMATGGAMRLKTFGPGPDSQLMQARVRPDEQVDIWRPGEGPDPRRGMGGGGSTTIVLQGESFNRSHIERLVEGINDLMRDRGGNIKLATAG